MAAFEQQAGRLSLARIPLDEFRRGSLLYRQAVSDLAYARMCYPKHAVVGELERLVGRAHSAVYQARRPKSTSWLQFWAHTWPATVRAAWRPILTSTLIFWVTAVVGFFLARQNSLLEGFFVNPSMRQAIASGRLWTESIAHVAPQASSAIAQNNISVALLAWALGMTMGIGTVVLIVINGLMLGVVAEACLRAGLLGPLAEFIVAHGALELPAIWISAGAGLILANAMLFPGRYRRSTEVRLAARRSVQLVVGTIPMLLLAAAIEGFVSPSNLSGAIKASLGGAVALLTLGYVCLAPRPDQPAVGNRGP